MKKKLWLVIAVGVALLAFALYRVGVILGELACAATVNRALARLHNADYDAVLKTGVRLSKMGKPAVKPLIAHLGDKNFNAFLAAEMALGRMGAPAIQPLRDVIEHNPNQGTRLGAVYALSANEDPRSIQILITTFGDRSGGVSEVAAHCFYRRGTEATGPLLAALRDSDKRVRMHSAEALEWSRGGRVVKALMAMLRNRKEWSEARSQAAWSLARIGDERGAALVARVLLDSTADWEVRTSAACALGELKTPEAKHALRAALSDSDSRVRESASYALRSTTK